MVHRVEGRAGAVMAVAFAGRGRSGRHGRLDRHGRSGWSISGFGLEAVEYVNRPAGFAGSEGRGRGDDGVVRRSKCTRLEANVLEPVKKAG